MLSLIEHDFPQLVETGYVKTSDETSQYNCIAFTLGDQKRSWWPPQHPGMQKDDSYWPADAPAQATIEAFVSMYEQQGFEASDSSALESGYVKVALFIEPREGLVEHAALQLPNGKWTSKMGLNEDIAHVLEGLEGPPHYFTVARLMKCRIEQAPVALQQMLAKFGG